MITFSAIYSDVQINLNR